MKKCSGKAFNPIILDSTQDKSLTKIIKDNHEEFIHYIHKLGLDVNHSDKTINAQHTSSTILTMKTRCFKVDFNDNSVKISPLE